MTGESGHVNGELGRPQMIREQYNVRRPSRNLDAESVDKVRIAGVKCRRYIMNRTIDHKIIPPHGDDQLKGIIMTR